MIRTLLAAVLSVVLTPAAQADPNPQLVASIEARLAQYGLSADVSQFATPTVVRLHFALSAREGYLKTRRELLSILRNPKYKQQ